MSADAPATAVPIPFVDDLYAADVFHRRTPSGPANAITDVRGVRVSSVTMRDPVAGHCTGLTLVDPGTGIYRSPLPAACHVINGYGKSTGLMQIRELGQLESPLALTGVFGVPSVLGAMNRHLMREYPEIGSTERSISVNSVVLECNDSHLHDPRTVHPGDTELARAVDTLAGGPITMGAVGAGAGMRTFGFAGGIGSASRVLELTGGTGSRDSTMLGVLTLSNFGSTDEFLTAGRPVGRILASREKPTARATGVSVITVIATDLPATPHDLGRLARRVQNGLARLGGTTDNGSGEVVVAFSTGRAAREAARPWAPRVLNAMFAAVTEAVEESVLRALLSAEDAHGRDGRVQPALTADAAAVAFAASPSLPMPRER
jgi:D-aminopeptidase